MSHRAWFIGSLLFSFYINDISTDIESEIRLFADDRVCYSEIKEHEDTVKRTRRMGKEMGYEIPTRQMQYDAADKKADQKINALEGTIFKNVDKIKYPGVTITEDLR